MQLFVLVLVLLLLAVVHAQPSCTNQRTKKICEASVLNCEWISNKCLAIPTQSPTNEPTTPEPSQSPTSSQPTRTPTTSLPSKTPTMEPTLKPTTARPTQKPTKNPTPMPTKTPTNDPTARPTASPTPICVFPLNGRSCMDIAVAANCRSFTGCEWTASTKSCAIKSICPTLSPTTSAPTQSPSFSTPTVSPTPPTTQQPSSGPTLSPLSPTRNPNWTAEPTTQAPSQSPTTSTPTRSPTYTPTFKKTRRPTSSITKEPTAFPSHKPYLRACFIPDGGCASVTDLDVCANVYTGCEVDLVTNTCGNLAACQGNVLNCAIKSIGYLGSPTLLPGCVRGNAELCDKERDRVYQALTLNQCGQPEHDVKCLDGGCTLRLDNKLKEEEEELDNMFEGEWFVDALHGSDAMDQRGSRNEPFQTLERAVKHSRGWPSISRRIWLLAGVHRLNSTLILTAQDSDLTIQGEDGAIVSGALPLDNLVWEPSALNRNIWQVDLPSDLANKLDKLSTLHINGEPAIRARYPNLNHFLDLQYVSNTQLKNWMHRSSVPPVTNAREVRVKPGEYGKYYSATGGACTDVFTPPQGYFCNPAHEAQGGCPFSNPLGVAITTKLATTLQANTWKMDDVHIHVFHHDHWGLWTYLLRPAPTGSPTVSPPTKSPTTSRPTNSPTTSKPTRNPTVRPSKSPVVPTFKPTRQPTNNPTPKPTKRPTSKPTRKGDTLTPTFVATFTPTNSPTAPTTFAPTALPTALPSKSPSVTTSRPTKKPTPQPTAKPTKKPTNRPTKKGEILSDAPTLSPTFSLPTASPSAAPTLSPTMYPTYSPTTSKPTRNPTLSPTLAPTMVPTLLPTAGPTRNPTLQPTNQPTTRVPTQLPTKQSPTTLAPSTSPTYSSPTTSPTYSSPTTSPTLEPTSRPTKSPTVPATAKPTKSPSTSRPSKAPTTPKPTMEPTFRPTFVPTTRPTREIYRRLGDASSSEEEVTNPLDEDMIWNADDIDISSNTFDLFFRRGGFQEARGDCGKGKSGNFFVENDYSMLDNANEYYLDLDLNRLYFIPNETLPNAANRVELSFLRELIRTRATSSKPIKRFHLVNIEFEHTYPTHMDGHEVPSGGDWSVYRGGAVVLEGAEHSRIYGCQFRYMGGNAVFLSNYGRDLVVERNDFYAIGSSAVMLVGDPLFNSDTPENRVLNKEHIERVLISENVASEIGIVVKQSAGVFLAIAKSVMIQNNVIFNSARAGIVYNDGFGGNTTMESNFVFNTVMETLDHGPFNIWDRQQWFQDPVVNPSTYPFIVKHNYLIGNMNGFKGVDIDDGARDFRILDNVIYKSVQKFKGQDIEVAGNVIFPNIHGCLYMTPLNLEPAKLTYTDNTCFSTGRSLLPFYYNADKSQQKKYCNVVNFSAQDNRYYGLTSSWNGCGGVSMTFKKWQNTYKQDATSSYFPTLPPTNEQVQAVIDKFPLYMQ